MCVVILAVWAVVDVSRGDRGGLLIGAVLAVGVMSAVLTLRRLPRDGSE